jgi:hypothetical protein
MSALWSVEHEFEDHGKKIMTKYRTICNISFFNSDIFIEKDNMVES